MNVRLQKNTYQRLVEDITALYDHARNMVVEAYWKIGKRIVEEEQKGDVKAEYGAQLIARLSKYLSEKYGRGFSERNLRNMRQFYISNKIWQETAKLSWTQHIEPLPIKSTAMRKKLESLCHCPLIPNKMRLYLKLKTNFLLSTELTKKLMEI